MKSASPQPTAMEFGFGNASSEPAAKLNRKISKPIMEKKRRARINTSLDQLKSLLVEVLQKEGCRHSSKMEKADILEMTVKHLRCLQRQQLHSNATSTDASSGNLSHSHQLSKYYSGFTECLNQVSQFLAATYPKESALRVQLLTHVTQMGLKTFGSDKVPVNAQISHPSVPLANANSYTGTYSIPRSCSPPAKHPLPQRPTPLPMYNSSKAEAKPTFYNRINVDAKSSFPVPYGIMAPPTPLTVSFPSESRRLGSSGSSPPLSCSSTCSSASGSSTNRSPPAAHQPQSGHSQPPLSHSHLLLSRGRQSHHESLTRSMPFAVRGGPPSVHPYAEAVRAHMAARGDRVAALPSAHGAEPADVWRPWAF